MAEDFFKTTWWVISLTGSLPQTIADNVESEWGVGGVGLGWLVTSTEIHVEALPLSEPGLYLYWAGVW